MAWWINRVEFKEKTQNLGTISFKIIPFRPKKDCDMGCEYDSHYFYCF